MFRKWGLQGTNICNSLCCAHYPGEVGVNIPILHSCRAGIWAVFSGSWFHFVGPSTPKDPLCCLFKECPVSSGAPAIAPGLSSTELIGSSWRWHQKAVILKMLLEDPLLTLPATPL